MVVGQCQRGDSPYGLVCNECSSETSGKRVRIWRTWWIADTLQVLLEIEDKDAADICANANHAVCC